MPRILSGSLLNLCGSQPKEALGLGIRRGRPPHPRTFPLLTEGKKSNLRSVTELSLQAEKLRREGKETDEQTF